MTTTLTIPPAPRLKVDRGHGLTATQVIERQIAWALLHTMREQFPKAKLSIDYGDEVVYPASIDAAMEDIFAVDECAIRFGQMWAFVICGNAEDFVSDYGTDEGVESAIHKAERHVGTRP